MSKFFSSLTTWPHVAHDDDDDADGDDDGDDDDDGYMSHSCIAPKTPILSIQSSRLSSMWIRELSR